MVQAKEHENERRTDHNMSGRFKFEDRFSGRIGEYIMEYLKIYEWALMDYKLFNAQVLQPGHNLFDEKSNLLYRDKVAPAYSDYGQAKPLLICNYNSIGRQSRVWEYLQGIIRKGII